MTTSGRIHEERNRRSEIDYGSSILVDVIVVVVVVVVVVPAKVIHV
jgi:hypothetical protein